MLIVLLLVCCVMMLQPALIAKLAMFLILLQLVWGVVELAIIITPIFVLVVRITVRRVPLLAAHNVRTVHICIRENA